MMWIRRFFSTGKNILQGPPFQSRPSLIRILGLTLLLVGCSKAKFEQVGGPLCDSSTQACAFDETIFVSGGTVDVLFVNDNSGSMSFEQSKMGQRFPNLLQKLDERMLDYRIGITTTDISGPSNPPRPINQNGALQDGRLVSFGSGLFFLEPNTPLKSSLFLETMQRNETLQCEAYIQSAVAAGVSQLSVAYQVGYMDNCPSGDERGILAAYRTVQNNPNQFIRPEAHLSVVIISDENVRSWGLTDPSSSYALTTQDKPEALIQLVQQKYPRKTLAVHSVVVRSGDNACLAQQDSQMGGLVKSQFGTVYEQLSQLTGGVIGSVCANDYGQQMGTIGAAIVKQVEYFMLHCENPENLEIAFQPASATTGYQVQGRRVSFDRDLDPSSRVRFRYQCPYR